MVGGKRDWKGGNDEWVFGRTEGEKKGDYCREKGADLLQKYVRKINIRSNNNNKNT